MLHKIPSRNIFQWLKYLETLHPKEIDLGLERIKKVAEKLHLFPFPHPVITVAGTNGKGTTVALLEAIFAAQGFRVATYTSPHLLRYNERVRIQNADIDDDSLCRAFEAIEKNRGDISLTYFEFGTLAALWLFKQIPLDIVILEVGLGGRLDAVNILDPIVSVITTIALDHVDWLGDTREKIALEKAGIMRVNTPVISGDFDPPNTLSEAAKKISAKFYSQTKDFSYQVFNDHWDWHDKNSTLKNLPLPKIPLQNASTVLKVLTVLPEKLKVNRDAIEIGLKSVHVPGRFQIFSNENSAQIILDVAHNPAAANRLSDQLKEKSCAGKTFAVIGMLSDKDHENTLKHFVNQVDAWYVGSLNVPRGTTSESLAAVLKNQQAKNIKTFSDIKLAYFAALSEALPQDRIIVFGSFYTVSAVLEQMHIN